jgi:tetratricopeptide (TPR) repeat protein
VVILIFPVAWHNAKYDVAEGIPHGVSASMEKGAGSFTSTLGRFVSGRFVMLATEVGLNFYIGNHWELKELLDPNHPECFDVYRQIGNEPYTKGVRSAVERSRYLFQKTIHHIRENQLDWIKLMGWKIARLANGTEISRNANIYANRQYSYVLSVLLWRKGISFPSGLIIPLGLLGIVLALREWRRHYLLMAFLLAQGVFVLSFFVTARYRLPSIPLLAIYSAFTVEFLRNRLRQVKWKNSLLPLIGLAGLIALCNVPVVNIVSHHGAFEHNALGLHLSQQGNHRDAIAQYTKALRLHPKYAMAHNNLATSLEELGRSEEAIAHYLEALEIDPEYIEAHCNLAGTLASLGREEAAVSHYREALRIEPSFYVGHYNFGNFLLIHEKTEEAISHYREAVRINPEYWEAHHNLGIALARSERTEEAVFHFRETLRIRPDYGVAHGNLAKALLKQGNTEEARFHFNKAKGLGYKGQ